MMNYYSYVFIIIGLNLKSYFYVCFLVYLIEKRKENTLAQRIEQSHNYNLHTVVQYEKEGKTND
jgi:hypothetical protein